MSRIRLTRDKTSTHPGLKIGTEGITQKSHHSDPSFNVYFPSIDQTYYIFKPYFEFILSPEEREERNKNWASAYEVVYTEGPMGGFRDIKYKYTYPHNLMDLVLDKEMGKEMLKFFDEHNIQVEKIIIPRKSRK